MNIKIKTLVIVEGEREVPLTKSIVDQLPHFEYDRYRQGDGLNTVGTVQFGANSFMLIETPDCGLTKTPYSSWLGLGMKGRMPGSTERIILLK